MFKVVLWDASGRQIFVSTCVNLLAISYGASVGWASNAFPFLESNHTTLPSGPISKEDSSWIQSIFTIGALIGSVLYGWASDRLGRKYSLTIIAIKQIIAWSLIVLAQNEMDLIISRFISGLSAGGTFILIPLFISEISSDNIRGRLGSIFVFSNGIGILFAYVCGTYMEYDILPFLYIPLSALFLISANIFPGSAHYFMKRNEFDKAEKSLRFYRNIDADEFDLNFVSEFESIKSMVSSQTNESSNVKFKDFLTKPARKVLIIGIMLQFLEQFCGVFALMFCLATIFEYSGSSLSPNVSTIIAGCIQLVGAYCSTILVDRTGRKILISISAFGVSIGMFIFSLHGFLKSFGYDVSSFDWIPLTSFCFVLWVANLGVLTLPFLVTTELAITLPNIKSHIYTMSLCFSWTFTFIILKYFETAIAIIGIAGLMLIFSISSLIGGIFVVIFVPETKDKSFPEILDMLKMDE